MKLRTLIADDEPLARERLRYLLSSDEEIEIVGECRNGREVIAALRNSGVDLLFLDIQMPGRSGFEVIEQVGADNVAFETDYPHADSTFPHSKETLTKIAQEAGLSDEELYKLARGNAIKGFGLERFGITT